MVDPKTGKHKSRYINGVNVYSIRARLRSILQQDFLDFRNQEVKTKKGLEEKFVLVGFNLDDKENINTVIMFEQIIGHPIYLFEPFPVQIMDDLTVQPIINERIQKLYNL